jgi:hypothetical protein
MKRPSKSLPSSLEHRLSGYALAASAAGVSVLALVQPAEARIVYTATHHVIGKDDHYNLDLNHDGTTDFVISAYTDCTQYCFGVLFAKPAVSNAVEVASSANGGFLAYALNRGAQIGPSHFASRNFPATLALSASRHCQSCDRGYWFNVKNRYLGLRLKIKARLHYGWARMSVKVQDLKVITTLTGYAYETIPNKPIIAGKTHGKDVITIRDSSLGALAAGANGLHTWRQK